MSVWEWFFGCWYTHSHKHTLQTSKALSPQQRRVQTRARQKQTVSGAMGENRTILREWWEWWARVCACVFVCVCLCKWVAAGKRGQIFFLTRLDYNTHTHVPNDCCRTHKATKINEWGKCKKVCKQNRYLAHRETITKTRSTSSIKEAPERVEKETDEESCLTFGRPVSRLR